MKLAVALLLAVPALAAPSYSDCRTLSTHGKRSEAQACYSSLTQSRDPFLRAEGAWGLRHYDEANIQFREAYDSRGKSPEVALEWGKLLEERFNPSDAKGLFEEALAANEKYAPAYLELARVAALGYSKEAVNLANKAIELNPSFVEAHEFLAYLALEDNDPSLAAKEANKALALSNEALDGMAVLASLDWLASKTQSEWIDKILKVNPGYGQAYSTGAHFLIINRRYDEGIRLYREALKLDNTLEDARSEMGINLMRLGKNEEARQQLELAYNHGYRNAQTTNALKFLDSLKDFETFRSPHAVLVLNKKEAPLLKPYIQAELERAIATYQKKYKMTLPGPVRLEVYPNHDDFVVRTLGLPGQGGLLGVTFDSVVAMDSPSARGPGDFRWAATLWHEMSHVYVIAATNSLVPRWFTEGLAVHEESAVEEDWGDRMTPEIVDALQKKKLLPVLELERGFVRPQYPTQVIVSYFEAGKILDFISAKWGNDAVIGMIHCYAERKSTPDTIEQNLHESPEAFDKEFTAWLSKQTGPTVDHFDEWKKRMKANSATEKSIVEESSMRDFYPDYVQANSAYEGLAALYLEHGKKAEAVTQLELYRERGGSNLTTLKKLAALEEELKQPKQAENTLTKLNYVYLEDEEAHRKLGTLQMAGGNPDGAIREFQAVLALKPADAAQSHYDLAKALQASRRASEARDEVLLALEAAPGYKPAQQLLLQLSQ